jgi:hypothetical protein
LKVLDDERFFVMPPTVPPTVRPEPHLIVPELGTPRHGMEAEWATLANELGLTSEQKRKLEGFMSDLQNAAWADGEVES